MHENGAMLEKIDRLNKKKRASAADQHQQQPPWTKTVLLGDMSIHTARTKLSEYALTHVGIIYTTVSYSSSSVIQSFSNLLFVHPLM